MVSEEDKPAPLVSTPVAILIGSVIISVAILISGGIIKINGNKSGVEALGAAASSAPAPAASTGPVIVQGITTGNLPVIGDKNAKVTVVEWADFQCPFCGRFYQDAETQIKKEYVDTGKVKYAFRDFAFLGQESNDSANAARCANDQGKFWEYHDYLYTHQGGENQGAFSKDNLKKFAADMGLNTSQFNQCVDSNKYASDVTKDTDAGKTAGVSGTPTIYINGLQLVGAQPYATVKDEIDKALYKKS